jgi:cytidylate kinase
VSEVSEPKQGLVVAIDGPAGAGKSTLSSSLARELDLPYINTGLMYRSVAAAALRGGIDRQDGAALAELARGLRFSVTDGDPPGLRIEGGATQEALTSAEVEEVVSMVARHPEVRSVLRAEQRRLGAGGSVMEGRDIGTVVFPDADVKLFLRAEPDERVSRRQSERGSRDPALAEALEQRDLLDARTNPLVPAHDAYPLDTTGRTRGEVLQDALRLVARALGSGGGDA